MTTKATKSEPRKQRKECKGFAFGFAILLGGVTVAAQEPGE